MKSYLVTGAAGFIGFHLCESLLKRGDLVVGIDNINDYYDPRLKNARLDQLQHYTTFRFDVVDVADRKSLERLFSESEFDVVMHMAAQAGVRYSIENPHAYADANLVGFLNVLEACRHYDVPHLLYASSSSVYGGNVKQPFSVSDPVNQPVSLYAATKRANELMAHSYSMLYNFRTTGLRFFTVYGPWGRPDMAIYKFAESILSGAPIRVFNQGKMKRDFTFINDAAKAVIALSDCNFSNSSGGRVPLSKIHNLGSNNPIGLETLIDVLEAKLGKQAIRQYEDMQPGDVEETYADTSDLEQAINYKPSTPLDEGIGAFVEWYMQYKTAMGIGQRQTGAKGLAAAR